MTEPATPDIDPPRPSIWRNLSVVWLVPVLALAVALGVAWQAYTDLGVAIEIRFSDAAGVTAGETTIRYRNVVIGTVERVHFTPDLAEVVVEARVEPEVAPYLDDEAQFWVVRPQVTTRGIEGLSTVVSGVYIEGAWDGEAGPPQTVFTGFDNAPLIRPGAEGRRITLRARSGETLSEGAPVFYRGIEVGRLERPRLTESGDGVIVDAFIDAPHDRRLTTGTRFWDASGFSVSIGPGGVTLDVESLSSLVSGGVQFDDIFAGGDAVPEGFVFDVFADENAARRSATARPLRDAVTVTVEFGESISGLAPGAPIQFGGLAVGEVAAIVSQVVETEEGPKVRLLANLALDPLRLGLPDDVTEDEVLDFLDQSARSGLRARLSTEGLFSSALIVEFVTLPEAEPAILFRNSEPHPLFPSVRSELPDFTATAEGVFERINALPIEELLDQAISTMASIEAVADDEDLRAMPGDLRAVIDGAEALIASEETQAIPGELRGTIADLRTVFDRLEEAEALDGLISAINRADAALADFAVATEALPELIEDLRGVAADASEAEIDELVASATAFLDGANALVESDDVQALPPTLNAALADLSAMLDELNEGGVAENLNETLASTRSAADAVEDATAELPAILERINGVAARADGLVASYGARSEFNTEALAVLRELRNAARSLAQLARTIERNPNSLVLGR